jgi:hypothetical protein
MYKDLLEDAERFGKSIVCKKEELVSKEGMTNERLLNIMDAQIERAQSYKSHGNTLACPLCYIRSGLEESLKALEGSSPTESRFICGACNYKKTISSR